MNASNVKTPAQVRAALLAREEIAFLDVREEDPHAQAHPLFAANLPLSKLELEAYTRLPRRTVPIVLLDDGEGLAQRAYDRLIEMDYTDVSVLAGGLDGWRQAGGEIFRDVNVPSKAFGEYVEAQRHTPALSAEEVQALLKNKEDVVVLDARRYDEYQTMNIPGSISVPGAELVLRARALAPNPTTRVIVNCAGRTRSIIGTQSLVNAGLPNPVAALRNGTIGWTLAGQTLAHGSHRRFDDDAGRDADTLAGSRANARAVADRAGVRRTSLGETTAWAEDPARTTYRFDVRQPGEYETGHLPGFRNAPGGQLVQETEMFAPTRGARVVLFDDDGVRAEMTASWLAQMNIETYVIDGVDRQAATERGAWKARTAAAPATPRLTVAALAALDAERQPGASERVVVLDFTSSANFVAGHIPGAKWIIRSRLPQDLPAIDRATGATRYVVTCGTSALAAYAGPEVAALTGKPVQVLEGGNAAWKAAGYPIEAGEHGDAKPSTQAAIDVTDSPFTNREPRLASPRIDRYRRPYEGTGNAAEAMIGYLEWEYGLVEQLKRDGTHGFFVV